MKLRIYKNSDVLNADSFDVEAYDAKVKRVLNGADEITFKVESNGVLDTPIGCTIAVDVGMNSKYYLNELPQYEKQSSGIHLYTFKFEAPIFDLKKVAFLNQLSETDFFFCGKAADFINLIVTNTDRLSGSIATTFTAGTIPDTEYKNLQFKNISCFAALNLICDAFNFEYEVKNAGASFTISLYEEIGNVTSISVAYGKDNGLKNIKRTNVNTDELITRLYYRGSNQNLPPEYNYPRLRGSANYIEQNVATFGVREGFMNFDDIKPQFQGTVGSFAKNERDEWVMTDSAFPFDLKEKDSEGNTTYLIAGTTAKINMLTGDCAGYTFDVKDYDHDTRAFKLIVFKHEDGLRVPNDTLQPAAGDLYTIIDIMMPGTYVTTAEGELDTEAATYLAQHATPRVQYVLEADTVFFSSNDIRPNLGDLITVNDTDLGISEATRVIEMNYPLFDKYKQTITLSDVRFAIPTRSVQMQLKSLEIAMKSGNLDKAEKILKSAKTTNELKNRVFNPDDEKFVPENNRPESLDPYMLALDSGEIQFSLKSATIEANYNGNANSLKVQAGEVIHHAYAGLTRAEIEKLQDEGLEYDPTRSWTIAETTLSAASASAGYYVYVKIPVAEAETAATIVLDPEHIVAKRDVYFDEVTKKLGGDLHYKLGYLSEVNTQSSKRKLNTLWGDAGHEPVSIADDGSQSVLILDGQEISIDLSGYATQSWVQNRGYLLPADLQGYASELWVSQNFARHFEWQFLDNDNIVATLGSDQDMSIFAGEHITFNYAANALTIAADLTGYATEQWVGENFNNYQHPDTHPASMITGLAIVATSGSYNDLSDKPTIPGDVSDLTDTNNLLFSGNYNDLTNKPTLFSGNYNDLTNKPDLSQLHDPVTLATGSDSALTLTGQELSLNLSAYATQSWVTNQGYLVNADLNGYASELWVLQNFAKHSEWQFVNGTYVVATLGTDEDIQIIAGTGVTFDFDEESDTLTISAASVEGGIPFGGSDNQIFVSNGAGAGNWESHWVLATNGLNYTNNIGIGSAAVAAAKLYINGTGTTTGIDIETIGPGLDVSSDGYAILATSQGSSAATFLNYDNTPTVSIRKNATGTLLSLIDVGLNAGSFIQATRDAIVIYEVYSDGRVKGTNATNNNEFVTLQQIAEVGISGSYTDLSDKPDLSIYATQTWVQNQGYLTNFTESDPVFTASAAYAITSTDITNWNAAYGWGDHAAAGYLSSADLTGYATESWVQTQNYLTSYTETDPIFTDSPAYGITTINIDNWNEVYNWYESFDPLYRWTLYVNGALYSHVNVRSNSVVGFTAGNGITITPQTFGVQSVLKFDVDSNGLWSEGSNGIHTYSSVGINRDALVGVSLAINGVMWSDYVSCIYEMNSPLYRVNGHVIIDSARMGYFPGGIRINSTDVIDSLGELHPTNGVSGTFTTTDGKTITATDGIITSIV